MHSISKLFRINATKEKVWEALTSPDMVNEWGGGPHARAGEIIGDRFEFFGGEVHGYVIQAEKNRRMRLEWYGRGWEASSIVEYQIDTPGGGEVILKFSHDDIPDFIAARGLKRFEAGWDKFIFEPMIRHIEQDA